MSKICFFFQIKWSEAGKDGGMEERVIDMAFDGITIACIRKELEEALVGGRIYKIAQPEADELLLTVKNKGGQQRVVISASASLPLIYLTDKNKPSPLTAPNFCMLLRKHLQNGRILSITQPGMERVLNFEIEHLDEMGDLCRKTLAVVFALYASRKHFLANLSISA